MTTDRSAQAALLALLDTMISEPLSFSPNVVAGMAERARDMIVALDSSLTAAEKRLAAYAQLEAMTQEWVDQPPETATKPRWYWMDSKIREVLAACKGETKVCPECDGTGCQNCHPQPERPGYYP